MNERVKRVNSLIKRIQSGDSNALDSLFVEFGALFLSVAKKYLFDGEYAQDLLGEVFLELCKTNARSFDFNQNGLNWMFTIIRHKAYRHNGQSINETQKLDNDGENSLANVVADLQSDSSAVDRIAVKTALESLSDYENKLLYLAYWECLTVREISKRIGKPRSTVHYDLTKALKKLKPMLTE